MRSARASLETLVTHHSPKPLPFSGTISHNEFLDPPDSGAERQRAVPLDLKPSVSFDRGRSYGCFIGSSHVSRSHPAFIQLRDARQHAAQGRLEQATIICKKALHDVESPPHGELTSLSVPILGALVELSTVS